MGFRGVWGLVLGLFRVDGLFMLQSLFQDASSRVYMAFGFLAKRLRCGFGVLGFVGLVWRFEVWGLGVSCFGL